MTEKELAAVVGRTFPGGEYTVEPYVDWLVRDVVDADQGEHVAHPLFAFIGSLRGKGMSLDELFEICGATAADGPMFGEHETEVIEPLRVGETYAVAGRFVSAERKHGRTAGTFDVVGFELTMTDRSGKAAVRVFNSFVFPRRAA
ncbi:hypothetical protein F4692_000937 [Nocardioides cavernae]|uniref:N-terminal of MaoC-like dehydratase domain-containing protein n=1 Tax=Nocardioides cavernae TaxID=1921566 RepID=A0A7Y9KSH6_9ACTN|nr:hypothetical protein [Nocardioides cavernae]NYE35833.1 hypothetical protein [Nocardioides cavernae]